MTEADPAAIVWGLFTKLEAVSDDGRDLPDPEVVVFFDAAEAEIAISGILSGWALTAAYLRRRLIEHAEALGCDCGSGDWLQREQVHLANREDV